MRALLDTHTFIWWIAGVNRLSRRARQVIASEQNELYVSAATAWEITTKARLGKLPHGQELAADVAGAARGQGFELLEISFLHGQQAGRLGGPVHDPFDLMLIAQSQTEGLPLVSNEDRFDQYGISRIW